MDASRLSLVAALSMALTGCDSATKPFASLSTERPTPVPVLPVPFKLAFALRFPGDLVVPLLDSTQLRLVVVTEAGDSMPPQGRLTFVSRNPEFVVVDNTGVVTPIKIGSAWVVASLAPFDHIMRDSVRVVTRCTMELHVDYSPPAATLRVGEGVVPSLTLRTCGGRLRVEETLWWRAYFPTDVIQVDSASGRITALKPGQAYVLALNQRGGGYPQLPVYVIP